MKNLFLTITIITLCFQSQGVWAMGLDEVSLQDSSSSSKTVVISRGIIENYNEGAFVKLFVQSGDIEYPKIFLVADQLAHQLKVYY